MAERKAAAANAARRGNTNAGGFQRRTTFLPGGASPINCNPVAVTPGILPPTTPQADYMGTCPNWAFSPLPSIDPATGAVSGGLRKFMDQLPTIPIANKMTPPTGVPNDGDYYEIGLQEYYQQMHADLPTAGTKLRGYADLSLGPTAKPTYLGPIILARKNRPVRIKFKNQLPTGLAGKLFIPVDTTVMGAGMGPQGGSYSQNRATLHLHGGNTPWISDGTPHQWTVPAGKTLRTRRG